GPRDEAAAGSADDARGRAAPRRRVRPLVRGVVPGVIRAVLHEAGLELGLERARTLRLRIPIDVERLDLGAEEVVGAARPELRKAAGVARVHELEHRVAHLDRRDLPEDAAGHGGGWVAAHAPAQPWQD